MPAILVSPGNLLDCEAKYIVHQCNAVSWTASGIAADIFKKFPYSEIYSSRKETGYHDEPGTIIVKGNGINQRYIVNLIGQYYPGKPKTGYPENLDDAKTRKWYFFRGLEALGKIKNLESVGFPNHIGCSLAGGNWDEYLELINKFSDHIEKYFGAKTYIYKL